MAIKFPLPLLKSSFKFCFFSFIVLLSLASAANAQNFNFSGGDSRNASYGVALSAGYDAPVGNLSYTFKSTPVYNFSFLRYNDNLITSVTIGHLAYQPKQSTFYYAVDDNSYGTIQYQNFTALQLYLGVAYKFDLTDEFKVYAGGNFGAYFTHFVFNSSDAYLEDNENLNEEDVYLAPKIGLIYDIADNLGVSVEGKYNLFAPTGDKEENERVGTLYNSYTASLSIIYSF